MQTIFQTITAPTIIDKFLHLFKLIDRAMLESTRVMEDELGVTRIDHFVLNIMFSALNYHRKLTFAVVLP
jgi:hypothetical protein